MKKQNNIEKMIQLRDEAHGIRGKSTSLALAMKQEFYKRKEAIRKSDNSPVKKAYLEEQLQAEIGKEFFQVLAKERADYRKKSADAMQLAKSLQLAEHEAPTDPLKVKEFERDIAELKTATMLGTNARRSIEAINALVGKYDEPFFAQQIKNEFSTLAGNVLAIESSPQLRQSLSRVLDRVSAKATNEEQRVAAEVLEYFGDGDVKFYSQGTTAYTAIESLLGREATKYVNDADAALELIAQAEVQ